jgi:hypothetical protein
MADKSPLTKEDLRPFFRALRRACLMVVRAIEQMYPDGLEV